MLDEQFKFSMRFRRTHGVFMLGADINIGRFKYVRKMYYVMNIYLGFVVFTIGKDYWIKGR